MRKILFCFIAISFALKTYSANTDLFTYDKERINTDFKELSEIEKYTIENNYPSYVEVNRFKEINYCSSNLNPQNTLGLFPDKMDWGSFAWGFCCCPIGFFVVAINKDKDSIAKESYWTGVVVNVVLSAISNVARVFAYGI